MENQNIVLMKDTNNTYSGEKNVALEINYRNGEQRLNIKVFFTKVWHDIIKGLGYVLCPSKRSLKVDLKDTCIYCANEGLHLTRVVDKRNPFDHKHYIDVVTGSEYCGSGNDCKHVVPNGVDIINGYRFFKFHGVVDSPINYMTSEEYVKMNDYRTTNEEKLAIIYSILQKANEYYKDEIKQKTM